MPDRPLEPGTPRPGDNRPADTPAELEATDVLGGFGRDETPPGERWSENLVGRKVAHYHILELLGGGGMGVVYKAEDARLERLVALKFLSPELTSDPQGKARFLHEAKAASALDHPNICTVYEVGETQEGHLYLAMAYYDGETLKKKIERGPLPVPEALDIAIQIAEGLDKAHRSGIMHRDIKPANLILTSESIVKILDFGIAKLRGTDDLTRAGLVLGTPAYMAPEQAEHGETGPAVDVWGLGLVLYEMLTGSPPLFVKEAKPLPPRLQPILERMLARDPAQRYQSAGEALASLREAREEVVARRWILPRALRAVAGVILLSVIAAALVQWWVRDPGNEASEDPPPPAAPPVQATFQRLTDAEGQELFPSLSPDGSFFVYVKTVDGNSDIYLQRVEGSTAINLTAGSPASDIQPAYSPDGQQIAFRSDREGGGIFVMGSTGESVRRVTHFGYNPAWSPDGKEILVATESITTPEARYPPSEIFRVEITTGKRRSLVKGDAVQPSWSPNGLRIAYWGIAAGSGRRAIWTIPAAGGEPVPVVSDSFQNWCPVWSPDGKYLYFASDRNGVMSFWRVAIDEATGALQGEPELFATPAAQSSGFLGFSRDGRRAVYATQENKSNIEAFGFDPAALRVIGPKRAVTQGGRSVRSCDVSPDGQWLAFHEIFPQEDLFLIGQDGEGLRQLTNDTAKDRSPHWSPAGDRLLFYSNRSGRYEAWIIRPDGGDLRQITRTTGALVTFPIWSPGGREIALSQGRKGRLSDVNGKALRALPGIPADSIFMPISWSPDGRHIAGVAASNGLYRVAIYSLASQSIRKLVDEEAFLSARQGEIWFGAWLRDSERFLFARQGGIWAGPLSQKKFWQILTPQEDSKLVDICLSPDQRTLYTVNHVEDGDVWRLSMN